MAKKKGEQLYSEFADIKALEEQRDKLLSIFDQIKKKHKEVSNLQVKIGQSKSIKAVTDAEVQYQAAFKEVLKLQKDYASNEAKLQILRSKEYEQVQQQKLAIAQLRKEQELRLKLRNAEEGSLDQMNLKLQKAQKIIQGFTQAQRESARGKEFIKFAGDLSNAINDIQKKAGNFRNNVGRYAESLADGFESVRREISRLQREQKTLEDSGDRGGAERVKRTLEDLERVQKISYNGNQNFSKSVRQLEKEFMNLATSGGTASKEFLEEFKKFVAGAKDQAEDLRAEIKALSSDTRAFDLVAGSISTLTNGYEAIVGAQALFGESSEDVQRSIQKLVAVQSIANGIRQVSVDLTTKGSAANKFYAFTQGLMATAMDKTAASATRLKAALGLLGIIATVIGGIAIALDLFKRKLSETEKAQQRLLDVNNKAIEGYIDAKTEITELVRLIKDENTSNDRKREILKTVNEKYSDQLGKLTDINQLETVFIKNADIIIKKLELKAKAQAAYSLAVEAAKEEIKILNAQELAIADGFKDVPRRMRNLVKKGFEEAKAEASKEKENFLKIYRDISTELSTINFTPDVGIRLLAQGIGGEAKEGKDRSKEFADRAQRAKDAQFELRKIELEAQAKLQEGILTITSFPLTERLAAYQRYVEIKNKLIDEEAAYEASKTGLTDPEKQLIFKKAYDKKLEIAADAGKKLAVMADKEVDIVEEQLTDMEAISAEILDAQNEKTASQLEESVKLYDDWASKLESRTKSLKDALVDAFQNTLTGLFDARKNQIQDQIDDIERLKAAEIDRINKTSESEEKKAARIKIVEAKAAADREALERRKRRIDLQRVIFERAFKAAQITFEGIQTVGAIKLELAKATARAAVNPFLLPALPLIASQIPFAIGTTAAQLVSLLAQPIPKFWTGTESAPEGVAQVAERGRELLIDPEGNKTLVTKPTYMYLKKGTKVKSNEVTEKMIANFSTDSSKWIIPVDTKPDHGEEIVQQLKKLNNKDVPNIVILASPGIETTPWFSRHFKN